MMLSLLLLLIGICLIHDIQTAPKSNAFGNKAEFGMTNHISPIRFTACNQCQILAFAVLMAKNETDLALMNVKMACREEMLEFFCLQIQGKESEFVSRIQEYTAQEYRENGKGKELCSNHSGCDPSPNSFWNVFWKPLITSCEQCQSTVFRLTNKLPDELPHERQHYDTKAMDSLKMNNFYE